VEKLELVRSAYEAWNHGDEDGLLELTHPDVEISPLVIGATSAGPWTGHAGVRRLLADARTKWDRFEIRCDDVLEFDQRVVAFVHVEVAARTGGPVVTGDIAHLIEFDGDLVTRFAAYRARDDAVAAALGTS
jgi:ketosteroid isomerase-like protein